MWPKRPSGTARRRRCSRRSSSRLASAELLPGSNCRSQTNRVTPASTVSSSRCSRSRRSPGGTRSAMRASMRRSASTSASAQSRSIVVVAGRMVRVRRQASTNLRDQVLVRLRLPGLGPHRVVAELNPASRALRAAGNPTKTPISPPPANNPILRRPRLMPSASSTLSRPMRSRQGDPVPQEREGLGEAGGVVPPRGGGR